MAQNPTDDDDDDNEHCDPNQWINTMYIADEHEDQGGQVTKVVEPAPGPSAKPSCQVRLFSSQETPPAVAFTEPQRAASPLLSPGALHRAAGEEIKVPYQILVKGKKGRKRSKANKSASQGPPPTISQDGPAEKSRRLLHVAGTPMICEPLLSVVTPHMRSVHHACYDIEKCRI